MQQDFSVIAQAETAATEHLGSYLGKNRTSLL